MVKADTRVVLQKPSLELLRLGRIHSGAIFNHDEASGRLLSFDVGTLGFLGTHVRFIEIERRYAMAPSRLPLLLLVAATALVASQPALAQTAISPPGRLLASNCFQCHGTNGNGPGFDKLAGKSARKLFKEMKAYQSGKEGKGIMASHAMGYSDSQLRELSQWLSQQQR